MPSSDEVEGLASVAVVVDVSVVDDSLDDAALADSEVSTIPNSSLLFSSGRGNFLPSPILTASIHALTSFSTNVPSYFLYHPLPPFTAISAGITLSSNRLSFPANSSVE